jgi:hypothetical protein
MGPTTKPNPTTLLAVVAMAGLSYVLLALVALHVLRPDLDPISSPISEYAIGPNGLLFTTALLSWGGASLVLAFGLHRGVAPSGQSPTGLVLLAVFGVGLIVAGIFPMDVPFPPEDFSPERFTAAGATHIISATIHRNPLLSRRPSELTAYYLSSFLRHFFMTCPLPPTRRRIILSVTAMRSRLGLAGPRGAPPRREQPGPMPVRAAKFAV